MSATVFSRSLLRCAVALLAAAFACSALAAAPQKKSPSWTELKPEQQQVLKPLALEWDQLDAQRRSKWLGIAKRYPKMTPTEQKRVQERMTAWVKLTPDQRRNAREQYRKIGKLAPDKREVVSQQWEEYQKLPDQVKRGLAAEPQKKPERIEPRKRTRAAKNTPPAGQPELRATEIPSEAPHTFVPSSLVPTSAN